MNTSGRSRPGRRAGNLGDQNAPRCTEQAVRLTVGPSPFDSRLNAALHRSGAAVSAVYGRWAVALDVVDAGLSIGPLSFYGGH